MHGLTRYILRQSFATAIFVTVALTAAIWLTQSLRLVDLIVNRGLSPGLFIYLSLLTMPRFIAIVLPIGIFIAALFTYYRLIAESEIVVMRAAGLSQYGLAKPGMLLGGIGVAALFTVTAYFQPAATRAFKDVQFEIRNKVVSSILQEGTFTNISDDMTLFVRARDPSGELTGFLVQDERDHQKPVTIVAERGAFVATDAGSRVFLVNGNRQQFDRTTGKLSVLTFDKYTLELDDEHGGSGARTREPQELYFPELLASAGSERDPLYRQSLILEAHQRLITPLSGLAFVAIALGTLLHGEFNRRGQMHRILLAVLLATAFEVTDLGLRNLATKLPAGILLMYLNVLAPTVLSSLIVFRDRRRAPFQRAAVPQPAQ